MAKKTNRIVILLACKECNRQNYTTRKNKINDANEKLSLNKYCSQCRKQTLHKEAKIKKGKAPKLRK